MSQASEHNTAHGDEDPGFFAAGEDFIVFGKPTPSGKPGEGALDHPAMRKHMKATGSDLRPIDDGILRCPDPPEAAPGMFHNLDLPSQGRLDPLVEALFLVSTIGPDQLETW